MVLVLQVLGDAQSVVAVQVVLQTLLVVSHAYGLHSEEVTALQTPVPSQVRAGVKVDPAQFWAAQTVAEA
jgi:predicted nucleic acid-binding protein